MSQYVDLKLSLVLVRGYVFLVYIILEVLNQCVFYTFNLMLILNKV